MLQSLAEQIEAELSYEPDVTDDGDRPRERTATCVSCDESTERYHACVVCGAVVCPCCVCRNTRGGFSCDECPGAYVEVTP